MAITYNQVNPFENFRDLLDQALREAPDKEAFRFKRSKNAEVESVTYRTYIGHTRALGAALEARGLAREHMACIGPSSYPWIIVYLMALQSGGVYVPIDNQLPNNEALHIVQDSDSTVFFYAKEKKELAQLVAAECPEIKAFIALEDKAELPAERLSLSLDELLAEGQDLDPTAFFSEHPDMDSLKLLVYTSGTTGVAKGVMLTENNLKSSVFYGLHVSRVLTRSLSVLPWHHTYEAVSGLLVSLHKHCCICINDSLFAILNNLKIYQPDYIYLVPAVAELFRTRILKTVEQSGKAKAFNFLIKFSNVLRKIGIDRRRQFFKQIHDVFGGKLERIVCGGAPIRPELGHFFEDVGFQLVGGYGITECSPLVCVNPDELIDYNTAGVRLPCVDWKIDHPNEEGIGEILVKGPIVFKGYYKQPEKTAEVLKDGWFYTGDYGYITPQDQLVITGRKKNIIVLDNGKNIYPEELEKHIQPLPYVQEVVCQAIRDKDGYEVGLKALIYCGDETPPAEKQILEDIHEAMRDLPAYKQIAQVEIRPEPFPKTTTNKIRRGEIH